MNNFAPGLPGKHKRRTPGPAVSYREHPQSIPWAAGALPIVHSGSHIFPSIRIQRMRNFDLSHVTAIRQIMEEMANKCHRLEQENSELKRIIQEYLNPNDDTVYHPTISGAELLVRNLSRPTHS